ncbi:MAG: hypothetical protein ACI8PZ_002476 [Myxococcota bacterium]|jgi:hypothetical protein
MRGLLALAVLAAVGCAKEVDRGFPDDIAPLEDNRAPSVKSRTEGGLNFECGEKTEEDPPYYWCHAKGWVEAPIADVYAATQVPAVNVDRREVAEWDVTWDVDADAEVSYRIDIVVKNIITVEYSAVWGHTVHQGTEAEPEVTWCVFDTVEGDNLIQVYRGSIVLVAEEDGLTEFQYIQHLKTPMRDETQIEQTIRDIYADVLDHVHGRDLQSF